MKERALSAADVWVPFGSGAAPIQVTGVLLDSSGGNVGSTTKSSAVRWGGSIGYPSNSNATVRFLFNGGVTGATSAGGRGSVSYNRDEQSVDVNFSLTEVDYGEPITISVRVTTASEEEIVLIYNLTDSGTATANIPKVVGVVVRNADEGFDTAEEASISRSSGGTTITATHSGDWSRALLTLTTESAVEMKNVSAPSETDYSFNSDPSSPPPYVHAIMPLDSSGNGSYQFDLFNPEDASQTFTVDVTS